MTNQEINKAIAEYIGYKPIPICTDMMGKPFDGWDDAPNYCGDLNKMNEIEKLLSTVHKNDYLYYLEDVCKTDCWTIMNSEERFRIINATAKQRAEAFLRTIGKWKE